MVSMKLDFKLTTQKNPCGICKKQINKGEKRVKLDNDNSYYAETKYFHLNCMVKILNDFKESKWERYITHAVVTKEPKNTQRIGE